jgi:hypothetical protein
MMIVRNIDLPIEYSVETSSHRWTDITDAIKHIKIAKQNGLKVISATQTIENSIEKLIGHYFFNKDKKKSKIFQGMILSTDWCTFRAKRRLLFQIINDRDLLQGKDKTELDKDLASATRYRNAFTHGLVTGNDTKLVLQYYEGGSQEDILDENYWSKVEELYTRLFYSMEKVSITAGVLNLADDK